MESVVKLEFLYRDEVLKELNACHPSLQIQVLHLLVNHTVADDSIKLFIK